ncbi:3-oxoadipate CoA-transferase alpha subunit [Constrictibacter sp. MBR-5]|uniref:CoA transferase subunit A n=1 Tax=Constrictibacter sp. MBR-5 TaxID=3156467 RepID=UPI0033997C8A
MIDKRVDSADAAIDGVGDGATVMISGFQSAGTPNALLEALLAKNLRGLTLVVNGVGHHGTRVATLFERGCVAKVICSSARAGSGRPGPFEEQWKRGEVELELVPQGTLAERIRAGAAGIAGFYTPVAVGTKLAEGKEVRSFEGKEYVLERALSADLSILRADKADRWGNLTYHAGQRNFGTVMAMAGRVTAVEVNEIVDGPLDPERVVTPGIFVKRVVALPDLRR